MYKKLIIISVFVSCVSISSARAGQIIGSGCSVSNYGYLSELAKEYERRTGIHILVRGGGTVLGIEDLKTGAVDFAAACRDRSSADPEDMQFVQVAWDSLVFIVHKTNRVNNITLDEVRAIYAGKITNWKQLGGSDLPIKVFSAKSSKGLSGINASLLGMVLRGKEPVQSSHLLELSSTGIVEQTVEQTPESFATAGYSSSRRRHLKMLKVNGVSPTFGNIVNKRYGLTRPLFIIIPKKPKPPVREFVNFVLSEEGQAFIRSQNVVALETMK